MFPYLIDTVNRMKKSQRIVLTSQHEVLEKSRELEACFILPTSFPMLSKNWTFSSDVWTVTANWPRRKMKYSTENSLFLSLSLSLFSPAGQFQLLYYYFFIYMSSFVIVSWQHGFKLQIMMVSQRVLISDFEGLNQFLQIASQTISDKVL